jgi:hypothetical protein
MKIQFKKIDKINLDDVFPIINKKDYELLSGTKIKVTDAEWKKAKEKGLLTIAGLDINTDLITEEDNIGMSELHQEVLEKVRSKFIYSDDTVDTIMTALETRTNCLLYGPGGHGKSEITNEIMNYLLEKGMLKTKPFVQVFGDGMTEEKLFGGMDIIKYRETGMIEYLLDNSFMNHKVVIFEELFDAPAPILLMLKDVLTSKEFRNGNQRYKLKTKVIIALTNRSRKEFSNDDSSNEALVQRFPIGKEVIWDTYKRNDFIKLFKKVYDAKDFKNNKQKLTRLAGICEMNNIDGATKISPRTAVVAGRLYMEGRKLEMISDLDKDIIKKYTEEEREQEESDDQKLFISRIESYIDENELEVTDGSADFMKEIGKMENEFDAKGSFDPSTLDFGGANSVEVKRNKAEFIMKLVSSQSPVPTLSSQFNKLKSRIQDAITLIDSESTPGSSDPVDSDKDENLPF